MNSVMFARSRLFYLPLLVVFAVAGCFVKESFEWRQKMTINVDGPNGPVSGAAVTSVSWEEQALKLQGMGYHFSVTGEAVVVDLGGGRFLFGLLRGAGGSEYMGSVAPASISGRKGRVIDNGLFREIGARRGRAAGVIKVPAYQYPLLVTFDDITKPQTVKRVDPKDLVASFGPGYALKSITLEITDDPLTKGTVEKVLGWIGGAEYITPPDQQPRYLKDTTVEQRLMPSDFIDWRTLRDMKDKD